MMRSISQEKRTEYTRQKESLTQRPTCERIWPVVPEWLKLTVLSRACQRVRQLGFSVCFWESCLEAWPRVPLAFS